MRLCACVRVFPPLPQLCLLTKSKSSNTPGATTTPTTQVLLSTSHTKAFWRNGWFLHWDRKGPRWAWNCSEPESKEVLKEWQGHVLKEWQGHGRRISQLDPRGFHSSNLGQVGLLIWENTENERRCWRVFISVRGRVDHSFYLLAAKRRRPQIRPKRGVKLA